MHVQHEESDIRGRHFILDSNGDMVAEITYAIQHPDVMVIDHTEVSEDLRGNRVGEQLVEAAVEHARAKGRTVVPACSFAKSVIASNSSLQDVLAD